MKKKTEEGSVGIYGLYKRQSYVVLHTFWLESNVRPPATACTQNDHVKTRHKILNIRV